MGGRKSFTIKVVKSYLMHGKSLEAETKLVTGQEWVQERIAHSSSKTEKIIHDIQEINMIKICCAMK